MHNRIDRQIRALALARQCAAHGARVRTISRLTGMNPRDLLRLLFPDRQRVPRGRSSAGAARTSRPFEVEAEVMQHPDVCEVAAVGAPSELSEDEVLVAVASMRGRTIDAAVLIAFLRECMARFMAPRYVRLMEELPKTPTAKVRKHKLREQGVTVDTWAREKAGIRVTMNRDG
jgi:hypothetical protein